MPAAQVEFHYGNESVDGVVYCRDVEEHLRVAHEAVSELLAVVAIVWEQNGLVGGYGLGDSLQHASRLENKGREDDAT